MHMKTSFRLFAVIIVVTVCCSGCASVHTQMGPLKSELKDGEKSIGEMARYSYSARVADDVIYLEKTPMCEEKREKIREMKKLPRGLFLMILEVPVFGLGVADFALTYAVIENSKEKEKLAEYGTGNYIECGKKSPAAGETLLIRNYYAGLEKKAVTDENASVNLDEVLPQDLSGYIALRIRVKGSEAPSSFIYTYNADSR